MFKICMLSLCLLSCKNNQNRIKAINTSSSTQTQKPFSKGISYGNTIYLSGQVGMNPETGKLQHGFDKQLRQTLTNISEILESQSLSKKNIIKTTVFLKDLNNYSKVNKAYLKYFEYPFPARSCFEVARLPLDAEVEIEVIAATKLD